MVELSLEWLLYSFLFWVWIAATAVSAGFHRYFTHKSFEASAWYEWYVLLLAPFSGSGHALGWVGVHRMHHRFSDTEQDPHSPVYKGYLRVLTSQFKVDSIPPMYVRDLLRNKRVIFTYKYHKWIRAGIGLVFLLISPTAFFWLFLMQMVWGYIGFGSVNGICHWGGKPHNNYLVAILAGGEGWHKNHHDKPQAWNLGWKWYEWDPGAWFIRLIRK